MADPGHGKRRDFDAPAIFVYAEAKKAKVALDFRGGVLIVVQPAFGPHDAPADRLEALRSTFFAILKDTISLASAEKQKLEIRPDNGRRAGRAREAPPRNAS